MWTIEQLESLPLEELDPEARALLLRLRARKERTVADRIAADRSAVIDGVLRSLRPAKERPRDPFGADPAPRPPRTARLLRGDL